ncbi:hypothetical protein GALL_345130 [mine drainage metagenome]|uniref:Uncharacterized protein n=1 Tax=mine drainage metagenome TaxID=410659 RepID=A0A1J5R1T5_9ZZZZ
MRACSNSLRAASPRWGGYAAFVSYDMHARSKGRTGDFAADLGDPEQALHGVSFAWPRRGQWRDRT